MKRAACRWPWKRQWSTSTTPTWLFLLVDIDHPAFFCWSTSTCLFLVDLPFSTCLFLVVDVYLPFLTCLFLLVDTDLPFSSCLFLLVDVDLPFSNWSTCLFSNWSTVGIRRRPSTCWRPLTSISQPFSSHPYIYLNHDVWGHIWYPEHSRLSM